MFTPVALIIAAPRCAAPKAHVFRARMKPKIKATHVLFSLVMLAVVAYLDYITGYEVTLLPFYLLPILYAQRRLGQGSAFLMAVISAVLSLYVDVAAGYQYRDLLTPIWNTGTRLAIFLLVVILFSHRHQLRILVDERTESLRQEIRERSRLEKELLEVAEAEQRRIGHDLHDSLGQHLTATALAAKLLAKKLASQTPVEPASAARVVTMVEAAIDLTRSLARSLHPMELRSDGLAVSLQNLADELSQAFHISCRFECSGIIRWPNPGSGLQLYRIAQEAASNAIRHGQARNLVISLAATSGRLLLTVTDDGTGLPADASNKNGMGLRIMHYRAGLIGAAFDLQNLPAGGARAVCVLNHDEGDSKS